MRAMVMFSDQPPKKRTIQLITCPRYFQKVDLPECFPCQSSCKILYAKSCCEGPEPMMFTFRIRYFSDQIQIRILTVTTYLLEK